MSGYIGVNGVARKIKKVYVGADGIAREVKTGYMGVDGVAKQWWSNFTPPPKGTLIYLNLDGGGNKLYRILSTNGSICRIMAMYDTVTSKYNNSSVMTTMGTLKVQQYKDSTLDTYLNTTWYNTLMDNVKTAIVPENIIQDAWYNTDAGSPVYTGTYGTSVPGTSNYTASKYNRGTLNVGSRKVFVLGVQDIIDYLSDESMRVDTTAILRNVNIWKMFWNTETQPSSTANLRLSSAHANNSYGQVKAIFSNNGILTNIYYDSSTNIYIRPVLNIDLSKISFTLA